MVALAAAAVCTAWSYCLLRDFILHDELAVPLGIVCGFLVIGLSLDHLSLGVFQASLCRVQLLPGVGDSGFRLIARRSSGLEGALRVGGDDRNVDAGTC